MPLIDPPITVHPVSGAVRRITPDLLAETYLAPRAAPLDISQIVGDPRWPWADSYNAAPRETTVAVEAALKEVISAVPGMEPALTDPTGLPANSRAARHLGALRDLWEAVGGAVPEVLAPLRHALSCRPEDALDTLPVIEAGPHPGWTEADRTLLDMLRTHHGPVASEVADAERARQPGLRPAGVGTLGQLQAGVLDGESATGAAVEMIAVRDAAAEAEVAAAMVQNMLDRGVVAAPEEIALLIPVEGTYVAEIESAFERVGLPLSGLPEADGRDLIGEAVRHLLATLRPGGGRTARASLMLSPLMPWDRATGAALARRVMDQPGRPELGVRGKALLAALSDSVETAGALAERLEEISGLVDPVLAPRLRVLAAGLAGEATIPWTDLLEAARPATVSLTDGLRTVEGVTVLRADEAPWRTARQLIVLGLSGDRYPATPGVNPFFLDAEIGTIARECGIRMRSRADRLAERMELVRRQLSIASDGIIGLVPRRALDGAPQAPAPLVTLLARCLGRKNADALIEDLPEDPDKWPWAGTRVPQATPRPAPPASGEIALGRDLLVLRRDDEGRPKPQSPSRLEKMLVSPLAWLLAEIGAEDLTWVAEAPDVLSRGSVAHAAFELLFPAGPVPSPEALVAAFDDAFSKSVERAARFYDLPDWTVDRRHLAAETARAAHAWRNLLAAGNAEIAAAETLLEGEAHGLALRGKADAVVTLPDGRSLVVDYKSGGSSRRRLRLREGWDLQAQLYMDLLGAMGRTAHGIGYLCLGDGALLAHAQGDIPGAERLDGDVSGQALARLGDLLAGLRRGVVPLNHEDDAKAFDKVGIGAYALEASPLVAAHTVPGGAT